LKVLRKKNSYKIGVIKQPKSKQPKSKQPKLKQKKKRDKFGYTEKQYEFFKTTRKVERPPYYQLLQEVKVLGFVGTGKKYGVSDNAIRKWIKFYEKIK
jgi:hypothetical protein